MQQNLEKLLEQALKARAEQIFPPENQLANIKREIRIRKEEGEMNYTMKKIIAVAAALCLLCASCFAAVQLGIYETHTVETVENYADFAALARDVDPNAKHVQRFENGFVFWRGGVNESAAVDEAGKAIGEAKLGLDLNYRHTDGRNLSVMIAPNHAGSAAPAMEGYDSVDYKMVPSDYIPTDEDKALEAAGDLVLTYGSDEIELKKMESYVWQDGGLNYHMIVFDCNFGEAEMAKMAGEIMG